MPALPPRRRRRSGTGVERDRRDPEVVDIGSTRAAVSYSRRMGHRLHTGAVGCNGHRVRRSRTRSTTTFSPPFSRVFVAKSRRRRQGKARARRAPEAYLKVRRGARPRLIRREERAATRPARSAPGKRLRTRRRTRHWRMYTALQQTTREKGGIDRRHGDLYRDRPRPGGRVSETQRGDHAQRGIESSLTDESRDKGAAGGAARFWSNPLNKLASVCYHRAMLRRHRSRMRLA